MDTHFKKDFPIFTTHPKLVYLDSAATAQVPEMVLDAVNQFERASRANVHRGLYALAEKATDAYEKARITVASFVGADKEEVIFTSGATAGINMFVSMFEQGPSLLKHGRVVTTALEHHGMYVPLFELAKRQDMEFVIAPLKDMAIDIDKMIDLITPETRLVGVTLASNVLGTITDIDPIIRRAHEVGAVVIVDAAKAVGHTPLDFGTLGADALVFSGHKMMGPMGIGVLVVKKELLDKLSPVVFGGGIVARVTTEEITWREGVARFEAGTPNISGAIGMAAAAEYIMDKGIARIRAYVEEITDYAIKTLQSIPGVGVYAALPEHNAGVVSFTVEGIHSHDVAEICARHQVAIRAGKHCAHPLFEQLGTDDLARASFHIYTTKADVDALVVAVTEAKRIFKK